jgi:hypothetical protein
MVLVCVVSLDTNSKEYCKKKCIAIKTLWKSKAEKPTEVDEFYSTANLAIEIIDRVLNHIEDFGESNDIGAELYQLQNTADQYKSHLRELVRGKKLNRHLDNSVRRTKIAKLNALLHSDVAAVLEVISLSPFFVHIFQASGVASTRPSLLREHSIHLIPREVQEVWTKQVS